jgi:4'-phosphopantetheinyl transferase
MQQSQVFWEVPMGHPQLLSNDVHIWFADLEVSGLEKEHLYSTLSADEKTRAGRFQFDCDRSQFVVARGILRSLAGEYLEIDPKDLAFSYSKNGKPALSFPAKTGLEFNLSHSADTALIGFSWNRPLGLDIEKVCPLFEMDELAAQVLTSAQRAWLGNFEGEEKDREFYRCWTRHEALMKCSGRGIAEERPVELVYKEFDGCLMELNPAYDFVAAVAIQGRDFDVKTSRWSEASHWAVYDVGSA